MSTTTAPTLFPLIISNSTLSSWSNCELRWFREYCQNYRKAGFNIDLSAGGQFAKGLETTRKMYYNDKKSSEEAIEAGYYSIVEGLHAEMKACNADTDVLKSPERMGMALKEYFRTFPLDNEEVIPAQLEDGSYAIEHKMTVELPILHPELGVPLIFKGKLDMFAKHMGRTYIVDEKTTKAITSNTADLLATSGQFIGYCLTPDHEVLTKEGWLPIDKAVVGLEVATWDTTGSIRWDTIKATQEFNHEGNLHYIRGKVSLLGTANHRQPIFNKCTGRWEDRLLGELPNTGNLRLVSAGILQEDSSLLDGIKHTLDLLRLVVAMQADGLWEHNQNGTHRAIFRFKKERKIVRMQGILDALEVPYSKVVYDTGVTSFSVKPCTYLDLIFDLLGSTKTFGSWLLALNTEELMTFTSELQHWDGSIREGRDSFIYSTTNKDNADWVRTAGHLSGLYTSQHTQQGEGCKLAYRVVFSTSILHSVHLADKGVAKYTGKVHCITVTSSYFLVRHNGKISVTGNCWLARERGITVSGAKIRKIAIQVKGNKVEEFEVPITDYQIDLWYQSMMQQVTSMKVKYQQVMDEPGSFKEFFLPDFQHGCTSFFRPCQFQDGCKSKYGESFIESNFEQRVWNAEDRVEVPLTEFRTLLGLEN